MFDVNIFALPTLLKKDLLCELLENLKEFGIESILLSPLYPDDCARSWLLNRALVHAAEEVDGCYVAPAFGESTQELTSSTKVRAVRVYPPAEKRQLKLAAELCESLGLPLIISFRAAWSGVSIGIDAIRAILSEHRSLKVILSCINYTETRWLVSEVASLPHTYVEVSMFQQMEGVKLLAKRLGVDKVLFGTAYPLQTPYVSILKLLFSSLCDEEIEKVARKNAANLLDIE